MFLAEITLHIIYNSARKSVSGFYRVKSDCLSGIKSDII